MKIKSLLTTTILSSCLISNSQVLNDVWKVAQTATGTTSTSVINSAKTNTTVAKVINTTTRVASNPVTQTVLDAAKNTNTKTATVINKTQTVIGTVSGAKTGGGTTSLTNSEVIKGLKEALTIGTNNSAGKAAKVDGYLKNAKLFIPWPTEAKKMRETLIQLGLQSKVTEFETSLNRAAEEAAKKAAPVFINAITGMSISDGFAILNGGDSAATHYLRQKTFSPLKAQFMPVVKDAIAKVKVTSYWNPLVTTYNKIPGVVKQNPDLNDYVCTKAINGLMTLILEEEAKIRKDPLARVTDILKKVFGYKK